MKSPHLPHPTSTHSYSLFACHRLMKKFSVVLTTAGRMQHKPSIKLLQSLKCTQASLKCTNSTPTSRFGVLFSCHLFPSFLPPPLKCSWEALTEMADKSIAITTPVFSFLSRASSSFIFLPQQLLGDPSVALIALLSWAFTSYFLLSAATLLL